MGAARFAIPSRFPSRLAPLGGIVACVVGGCTRSGAGETVVLAEEPPGKMELQWREEPLGGIAAKGAQPVTVKAGVPPLLYLVETPQIVRILDQSNNSILAEVPVGRRTIVRVDEQAGVYAGSRTLVAGPLPAGRRYGIYVVPDGENVSRTGTFQPRPQPPVEPGAAAEQPPASESQPEAAGE